MDLPPPATAALLLLGSYLLGSVPFAFLLGLARGVDIRKVGSGNIGATNLSRALGRRWGAAAFALDFAKGLLPALAAASLERGGLASLGTAGLVPALAGLAAILGHVFPVYLRFRGGKGVATTFGVMAGLSWLSTLAAGAVWGVLYLATRTVSVASIAAALALPAAVAVVERSRGAGYAIVLGFASAMSVLVIVRHRANIARLLRGEELKFSSRR
ncbi:MAG: glycerol-3-phosphate 1-O-acyltransferase PlsY [Planctomycetes bacterium]|nr:glycerol-3-phosphate 1-O-acyltransferase PlsY [Planctomycetota bacterium]